MREKLELPNMPDFVSIKDAAKILGVSDKRVYAYIEDGRLPAVRAAHVIMIPLEEVKKFKPKIAGRPRKNTPLWRTSPSDNKQFTTSIHVQIQKGQQKRLEQKLQDMREAQEHIFPGTIARYIIRSESSSLEILLIWRGTVMPGTIERELDLDAFREALVDILDWEHAEYREGEILLHA